MLPVVVDINILVGAVTGAINPFHSWPSPPPVRGSPSANVIGILNDAREFSFFLSEHILANTVRVLVGTPPVGYGWEIERVEDYLALLVDIADASGGGVVQPGVTVTDCDDFEDNRILECALACGAVMIVSDDDDLLRLSPWRGCVIVTAAEFVGRTDAMRRARRR